MQRRVATNYPTADVVVVAVCFLGLDLVIVTGSAIFDLFAAHVALAKEFGRMIVSLLL